MEREPRIAERIRTALLRQAIPHVASRVGVVTVSIGIAAAASADGTSPQGLIAAADASLYEAKARGRNQVWPKSVDDMPAGVLPAGFGKAAAPEHIV